MVIKKISKRAQMKIQQMAFMLMAVTLFFILVGLFALVWRFAGLKGSAVALEEENAMLLVTKLANSPEFSCGNSFGSNKLSHCIDADKVINLKKNINDYNGFWGNGISNIKIETIYPIEERENCNIGNYPDCNVIDLFEKGIQGVATWNFVTVCKKATDEEGLYDKCDLGKLYVYTSGEQ